MRSDNTTRPDWRAPVFGMVLLIAAACGQPAPEADGPRPVFMMEIADPSGLSERSFPGRARAGQEVNRSFRVSGPLIALPVNVGDAVEEGQLLARIDPADYISVLNTLEGQLEREKANQTRARADLRRIENVLREDPGATSEAAVDQARQLAASADAAVRSLEASVQNARDQLSYTYLDAPFDGVVVDTYVENFETVLARQPILRLLDPSSIEMIIQVPENLISQAAYVEGIVVRFDALPGVEVPAEIKEIGREATRATRTFPVTLVMEQPEEAEILPGMAGTAAVSARPPAETALTGIEVPMSAVFTETDPEQPYVWIVERDSSTLEKRAVTLGMLTGTGVLVTSGLAPGETIVTKGVHTLSEGEAVRRFEGLRRGNA